VNVENPRNIKDKPVITKVYSTNFLCIFTAITQSLENLKKVYHNSEKKYTLSALL